MVGIDLEPGAEGELAIEADVTDEAQVQATFAQAPGSSAGSTC